ncbi:MAG: DUF3450 family protein [Planctomycetota bacterium]|nr:DUF3450 family protein [Planctomycetota bacterium]
MLHIPARATRRACWLAAIGLGLAGLTSASLLTTQEPVEEARAVMEKWVDTKRVLSQEKRDWQLGREILGDRIELVKRELESLRAGIAEAQASIAEADSKHGELAAEKQRLAAAAGQLEALVPGLESRLRALLLRLPEPLLERVAPLSQRLPEAEETEVDASLGERFQNLVGILNEANKFHGEVSVASEVRSVAGGRSSEVTALYLGLGQGFYVTGDDTQAGVRRAGDGAWTWRPIQGSQAEALATAADIRRAIRVLSNELPASFVKLPVEID